MSQPFPLPPDSQARMNMLRQLTEQTQQPNAAERKPSRTPESRGTNGLAHGRVSDHSHVGDAAATAALAQAELLLAELRQAREEVG